MNMMKDDVWNTRNTLSLDEAVMNLCHARHGRTWRIGSRPQQTRAAGEAFLVNPNNTKASRLPALKQPDSGPA